jgi:hypothetical protein
LGLRMVEVEVGVEVVVVPVEMGAGYRLDMEKK